MQLSQLFERNAMAIHEMVMRLRDELRAARDDARAAGDGRRAAELDRAYHAVMAVDGAVAGKLSPGRHSDRGPRVVRRAGGGVRIGPDDRTAAFTAEELAAMLWDGCALGFAALTDWRARAKPARTGK